MNQNKNNIIGKKNPIFNHLLIYQKKYIFGLASLLLFLVPLINFFKSDSLLIGPESYYFLSHSALLQSLASHFTYETLIIIPIFLGLATLYLFFALVEKLNLSDKFTFFFLLLLVMSPAFIYTYSSLTANSFYFLLIIATLLLLMQEKKMFTYLAIIPLILATFFDVFSSLMLFVLLIIYAITQKKNISYFYLGVIVFSSIIQYVLGQPFFLGPFHAEKIIHNLISDFGGLSGVSFFAILLSLIGISITWKRKKLYWGYIFLPLLLPFYFFSTQIIFPISILILFFAAVGFVKLFERTWNLAPIKQITFFLLILGILFSTLSYLDRIDQLTPPGDMIETLTWISYNTGNEVTILSDESYGDYITFFAKRKAFSTLYEDEHTDINQNLLENTNVIGFISLLENQSISILYISKDMKKTYKDNFIILLQNERFKLIHSHGDYEVWAFSPKEA
ncbi:hypothetical protein HQ489_05705 [Candidatus Woesearchaeota archaeon]|nr:hypothetical protein [Candidatus Woesearchaeota archaeon]